MLLASSLRRSSASKWRKHHDLLAETPGRRGGARSTIRMPDGSLHTCRHYLDGIVMWDGSDTDDTTKVCRQIGVDRMNGGAK